LERKGSPLFCDVTATSQAAREVKAWNRASIGLVKNTQFRGQVIIPLRFTRISKQFVRLPHIQKQGRVKILDATVRDGVGPVQRDLIPAKLLFRVFLVAGQVMRGNTGLKIISRCLPGQLVEGFGFLNPAFKFCLCAFNTKLDS